MKIRFTLIILIGTLLFSCNSESAKWEKIKKTSNVYLKDTMSYYVSDSGGHIEKKWINENFRNYQYKKYCKNFLEAIFEKTTPRVNSYTFSDTFSLAKMLLDDLRKVGVAHLVGQILNEQQLKVYIYYEDGLNPFGVINNFRIPFDATLRDDSKWELYLKLFLKTQNPMGNTIMDTILSKEFK